MKAMTLGRPAKAALVAALALIIAITVILWVEANISPTVTASSPATSNLQLNSPMVIVPPPTITPLRIGNVPTATPISLAPLPAAPSTPGSQHNKGHKHAGKSGKGDG